MTENKGSGVKIIDTSALVALLFGEDEAAQVAEWLARQIEAELITLDKHLAAAAMAG